MSSTKAQSAQSYSPTPAKLMKLPAKYDEGPTSNNVEQSHSVPVIHVPACTRDGEVKTLAETRQRGGVGDSEPDGEQSGMKAQLDESTQRYSSTPTESMEPPPKYDEEPSKTLHPDLVEQSSMPAIHLPAREPKTRGDVTRLRGGVGDAVAGSEQDGCCDCCTLQGWLEFGHCIFTILCWVTLCRDFG